MGAKKAELSGAIWVKASYSAGNGACVEVAQNIPGFIAVRDSKNPDGGALVFTPQEWACFLAGTKDGEFDLH